MVGVGMIFDETYWPFFLQAHQRIADRRRTDAELSGQRGARQRRPRRQIKRDDHAAQAFEHLWRRLTIAIQPLGGTQAGAAGSDLRWTHRTNDHFKKVLASDALIH